MTDDIALIQTLDFFTPIVDDPFDFGRIAAANALSDVYAMGGRPLTAMNIVCFPIGDMDKSVLSSILQGGLEIVHQSNAVMVGGHSVEDPELKYGLSLTGIVHPRKILTNAGAEPGDLLVLTKPLGTGILATALKAGELSEEAARRVTEQMATLNKGAAEAMIEVGVNACTDITGFGLLGHCLEMARASKVGITIDTRKVPIIPGAETFAGMGMVPGGSFTNRKYYSGDIRIDLDAESVLPDIMFDPQTSGGLLISVPENKAPALVQNLRKKNVLSTNIIGSVRKEMPGKVHCHQ